MLDSQKGLKMKHFAKSSHQGTPQDKFRHETLGDCDLIGPPVVAKIIGPPVLMGLPHIYETLVGSLAICVFYVVTNALKCVVVLDVVCQARLVLMLVCQCVVARSSATDSHSRPHYWINLVPAVRSSLYHSPAIGGGAVTGLIVILNTLTYNAQLSLPPISVAELEFYNWKCFLCKHRVG